MEITLDEILSLIAEAKLKLMNEMESKLLDKSAVEDGKTILMASGEAQMLKKLEYSIGVLIKKKQKELSNA